MSLIIPNSFAGQSTPQLASLDENFTYLKTELDPYVNTISLSGSNVALPGNLTLAAGSVTATGFNGPLNGNITGDVTGNLTGNVTGNIDGNISGIATLEGNSTLITGATLSSAEMGSIYAPGMIIQTVYKRVDSKDVILYPAPASGSAIITPLDTSFTPKFANSLIHIQMCLTYEVQADTTFRLYRDSTWIGANVNDTGIWSGTWLTGYDANDASTPTTSHFFYVDTPGSIATINYRLGIMSSNVAGTFYLNRAIGAVGQAAYEVGISQVIIQEIKQ